MKYLREFKDVKTKISLNKLTKKILNKINFIKVNKYYKKYIFEKPYFKVDNIFDYNYIIRKRKSIYQEDMPANEMYGIGYCFRRYSGYYGQIYCASEHGIPPLRVDNYGEFRDNGASILLVPSVQRREILQPLTNKLILTYGPSFIPYACPIYDEFSIKNIKNTYGKTLVVFPQHDNDVAVHIGYLENANRFIEITKEVKEKFQFDTVIACMYYIDIERGMDKLYRDQGWQIVSAGYNKNYDFADCLLTIFKLSDGIITQGFTGIAYATYLGIPALYVPGRYKLNHATIGKQEVPDWVIPTDKELERIFGKYFDKVTDEQMNYCNEVWGYDQVKTQEELREIFLLAKDLKKRNIEKKDKIDILLNSDKYSKISFFVAEAIKCRGRVKSG